MESTSLAGLGNCLISIRNGQIRFWIVTLGTQDKFANETVQKVLQFGSIMGAIHNETFILCVCKTKQKSGKEIINDIFLGGNGVLLPYDQTESELPIHNQNTWSDK